MFRYVLSLTFAVSFATAATFSTTATCDGVTTVGSSSAMCSDALSFASAQINGSLESLPFTVYVDAGPNSFPPGSASASASFSDEAVLTVFGGTGTGFFLPCLSSESVNGGSAEVIFGGVGFVSECSPPFFGKQPFTFGVPQIVQITAEGSVSASFREDTASASLNGIAFLDNSGDLLQNVTYTLVGASVPEPSAWSLLSIGLMFFVVGRIYLRQSSAANSA